MTNEANEIVKILQDLMKNSKEEVKSMQAATLALMKLLDTFPWLADVADFGYDPKKAKEILIREANKIMEKRK